MVTKIFDLGKKPYSYQVNEETDVVLLGKSEWREGSSCKLSFMFAVLVAGEQISIEQLAERSSILGEYVNRSPKFNSGNFTNFDAQRYIKSRYRDIIRHANRQQSGTEVHRILEEYTAEYTRQGQRNEDITTSAELVESIIIEESEARRDAVASIGE